MRVQSGEGMGLPNMVFPRAMAFAKQHDTFPRHPLEQLVGRYDPSGRGIQPAAGIAADVLHCGLAVIGGEGNGGVIDPRVGYVRDSFVGMALLLDAMVSREQRISDLADELPGCWCHGSATRCVVTLGGH